MANGNRPQIFGEEDLQRIEQSLAELDAAREVIELGKQAGLPMEQFEERQRDARDKLLRIKNTFFPGR